MSGGSGGSGGGDGVRGDGGAHGAALEEPQCPGCQATRTLSPSPAQAGLGPPWGDASGNGGGSGATGAFWRERGPPWL